MKSNKSSEWTPVQLSQDMISKGIEGLIGIEELTDYKFQHANPRYNVKRNKKQKNKQKKKLDKVDEDGSAAKNEKRQNEESDEPQQKKRKLFDEKRKKKKKKRRKFSGVEWEVDEAVNVDLLDKMSAWVGLGIPEPILKALAEQGFEQPTVIQARTLPAAVMGRRDILGAAETGSGKTLAFGIPILHHIMRDKERAADKAMTSKNEQESEDNEGDGHGEDEDSDESEHGDEALDVGCVKVIDNAEDVTPRPKSQLYALILTPTRELAIQIHNHLKAAAKYTGIKIAVLVGGMAVQKQERLLRCGPEIVVATPGRLWEMIQDGNSHLSQVRNIRYLAVDETDRMLEKGHFKELQNLLEVVNVDEKVKRRRQNFVFSATLTMVHDPPHHVKGKLKMTPGQKLQSIMSALGITNPKVVDITNDSGTASTLSEARILCTLEEKDLYLYYFLQRHRGRTLVFCNSITCVRRLTQLLSILKCQPLALHANMAQRQRLKNLDRFRDNPHGVLLATDVAARGLDIPDVEHVVHYQVPRTSESYVHRSGRTARAQKEGLTLLLIDPAENLCYVKLCRTLGRSKDLPIFPVSMNALDVVKRRVSLARELDQLELVARRSSSESGWYRKALTQMDMLIDEDEIPSQMDEEQSSRNKRIAAVKRKQLDALLARPLFHSSLLDTGVASLKNEQKMLHSTKKHVFVKRKKK